MHIDWVARIVVLMMQLYVVCLLETIQWDQKGLEIAFRNLVIYKL